MLKTQQNVEPRHEVACLSSNQEQSVALPLANMQKSMMDAMDKRRLEWEKEVDRMAEDFFQVKLAKPDCETRHQTVEGRSVLCLPGTTPDASAHNLANGTAKTTTVTSSSSGLDLNPVNNDDVLYHRYDDHNQPEYYRDESQVTWCRLRFDLRGYEPGDISVRVEGCRKLIVSGRHVQSTAGGEVKNDVVTRQMSKTVDVPHRVRPDRITSYLSKDGYLFVIAPVDDKAIASLNSNDGWIKAEPRECEFKPIHQPLNASITSQAMLLHNDNDDGGSLTNRNVIRTDDGDLMLKIVVDLGRADYEPENVTVQFFRDIVRVLCRREQQLSSSTSPPTTSKMLAAAETGDRQRTEVAAPKQMLRHEFSRDFDLPAAVVNRGGVHGPSVRVTLGPDGRLWIGASLEVNNDPSSHRRVAGVVAQMMPRFGRSCRRTEIKSSPESND